MPAHSPRRLHFQGPLLVALATVAAVLSPLTAEAWDDADSPLKPGAWAVEFQLDPVYRYEFGFFSGVTISAKRHHSARSALRVGASVGFDESKDDGETSYERYSYYSNPNYRSAQGKVEGHDESHAYSLFLHLQRYHPVREAISIFWEVGPSFRYNESKSSNERVYPYDYYYGSAELSRSSRAYVRRSASLDLDLGFEWFFTRRLSFGARLGAWGGYSWGVETSGYENYTSDGLYYRASRDRSDVRRVAFYTNPATVTFSAYF